MEKETIKFEGISPKQTKELTERPIIETSLKKSSDGQWLIIKTTILDIKPMTYLEKVLD